MLGDSRFRALTKVDFALLTVRLPASLFEISLKLGRPFLLFPPMLLLL